MVLIKSKYGNTDLHRLPTLYNTLDKIISKTYPHAWIKPTLITLSLTGARVSEVNKVRRADIEFFYNGLKCYPVDSFSNVDCVYFHIETLKQRKTKKTMRVIPIPVDDTTLLPLKFLWEYVRTITNPDELLFNRDRRTIWQSMRKNFDADFYPHLLRKIAATADGTGGMSITALQKKFGWVSANMPAVYVDINPRELLNQQRNVFAHLDKSGVEVASKSIVNEKSINNQLKSTDSSISDKKKVVMR